MESAAIHGPIGVYGKIPAQGDFVRADVPAGFARVWDAWLQNTLSEARAFLGHRWQECYFTAPIWRFSLDGGVAGRAPVMGVMMPSVDRVGRAFPLTLVLPWRPGQGSGPDAHLATAPVLEQLEEIALQALDDTATWNGLLDALRTLCPLPAPSDEGSHEMSQLVSYGHPARCQWSALWNDRIVRLQTAALPDVRCFVAMLDPSHPIWKAEASG